MPNLSLEEFDNPPKIGDKITVTGKVEGIDEESNQVEVSYDSIKVNSKDSTGKEEKNGDNNDNDDNREQSIDDALANSPLNPNY